MSDPMNDDPTITITRRKYLRLFERSLLLAQLESAGVDNWEGFSEVDHDYIAERLRAERNLIASEPEETP